MTPEELNNITVGKTIDTRGTACPGPLLEAKKNIGKVGSGEVMEVISSDEGTKKDVPKWADKKGHEFLGVIDEAGYFRIFLRKK